MTGLEAIICNNFTEDFEDAQEFAPVKIVFYYS